MKDLLNKQERIKLFKSMTSIERQELILKKMKDKGIEVGSGIPNKQYDSKEVYELIHIANCFPELRKKNKNIIFQINNVIVRINLKIVLFKDLTQF